MQNEMGYILAQGPEGLETVLDEIVNQPGSDQSLREKPYYILYELGNQKSLIKMDMSEWPVVFWHYDLLGRPATHAVKDILAKFVWDKCGEKEWYFKEKGGVEKYFKGEGTEETAFIDWKEHVFEHRE